MKEQGFNLPENGMTADDVYHMVMEYDASETWGDIVPRRSARVILHCDRYNSKLPDILPFHATMNVASGKEVFDLAHLSGIHLLDRESASFQDDKFAKIIDKLKDLPRSAVVHLDIGHTTDETLLSKISYKLFPHVNSVAMSAWTLARIYKTMNPEELSVEELDAIVEEMKEPTVTRVLKIIEAIEEEVATYPRENHKHVMGRMHVYAMNFHVVSQFADGGFDGGATSVAVGSFIASVRSCGFGGNPKAFETDFSIPLATNDDIWGAAGPDDNGLLPVYRMMAGSIQDHRLVHYVSPVMVCKNPYTTHSLADTITSMSMMYHQFDRKWFDAGSSARRQLEFVRSMRAKQEAKAAEAEAEGGDKADL